MTDDKKPEKATVSLHPTLSRSGQTSDNLTRIFTESCQDISSVYLAIHRKIRGLPDVPGIEEDTLNQGDFDVNVSTFRRNYENLLEAFKREDKVVPESIQHQHEATEKLIQEIKSINEPNSPLG